MTHGELIHSAPGAPANPARRRLLKGLAAGAGAGLLATAGARARSLPFENTTAGLAPDDPGDETFWAQVKAEFALKPGLLMFNAANLCPSPRLVTDEVVRLTRDLDADASFQNREKYTGTREASRTALAGFLGADAREIALTRNTSEGNNTVVTGLELGPGDEVVLWDQNHESNGAAWALQAERLGFALRWVTTPAAPTGPAELIAPFAAALSGKTRLLAFSHVSNLSGVALPAAELCALARQAEALSLIDGAQTLGVLPVNLHDLGCDFYAASNHKWLMGPRETGVLYVRADRIEGLWPTRVTHGWEQEKSDGARRFESLGQRDDARVAAVGDAIAFHHKLGKARVEQRIRALAARLKKALGDLIPGAAFVTPPAPELSAGIVIVTVHGVGAEAAAARLYAGHGVACATFGDDTTANVRLCPHVYTTAADVDQVAGAVASLI